jgi:hypothetical protein
MCQRSIYLYQSDPLFHALVEQLVHIVEDGRISKEDFLLIEGTVVQVIKERSYAKACKEAGRTSPNSPSMQAG